MDNNITFIIEEDDDNADNTNKNDKLFFYEEENKLSQIQIDFVPQMVHYNINYTVKGLLNIADYYGLTKSLKLCKSNKEQIIGAILFFENDPKNEAIVYQRNKMWHYMDELKKDRHMKKFILCWN